MSDLPQTRVLDAASLRALAHPLRIELYNALSAYGAATASGLAERLGESTGSTSYHLRQLARHGLVREIEDRGSGRERWWERTPGSLHLNVSDTETAAERAAAEQVSRQFDRSRAQILDDFNTRADTLGPGWYEAATMNTANVTATIDELRELGEAFDRFTREHIDPLRRRPTDPTARRIQVHMNAFPVVDPLGSEVRTTPSSSHTLAERE